MNVNVYVKKNMSKNDYGETESTKQTPSSMQMENRHGEYISDRVSASGDCMNLETFPRLN